MMAARDWCLNDFDYALPEAQIAQAPLTERSASRMLAVDPASGQLANLQIRSLPHQIRAGDLVVFNDTRVIPARLHGQKGSGGQVEVLIERVTGSDRALAQVRASKSPKPGTELLLADGALTAVVQGREGEFFDLEFATEDLIAALEQHGRMPLPPYIQRSADQDDASRYQTVFGRHQGAVAAPTAGLHFDQALLDQLQAVGAEFGHVTLHVGAGTFQPVRVDDIASHQMHAERVRVPATLVEQVYACRKRGGRVIAIGTTVVRSLETAAADGELQPFEGESRLFIRPGYRFKVVDALLTNFHLPRSTLLMLVSAFAGYRLTMRAYQHAVSAGYRFFSYGDAMWISGRAAVESDQWQDNES